MSRFLYGGLRSIAPYVPGEQPRDKKYIKLNTNENPFYTSARAVEAVKSEALKNLNRYSDPDCANLTKKIADYYGVDGDCVLITNGSDEALAFAFYAFCRDGAAFADVTYGFYEVAAKLFGCPIKRVPLDGNLQIVAEKYYGCGCTAVIANPNAQTGIAIGLREIESIIKNNADNLVIVDQAYADFSECNAVELTKKYDNILTVNTFSKSRSLAGARVGYAIGPKPVIDDLKKIKNSFHPYNVNALSQALAAAAIEDEAYFKESVQSIVKAREELKEKLQKLGFNVLNSSANFLLAKNARIGGENLYKKLKDEGVLVRHFSDERIEQFIRITVGNQFENGVLIQKLEKILAENGDERD